MPKPYPDFPKTTNAKKPTCVSSVATKDVGVGSIRVGTLLTTRHLCKKPTQIFQYLLMQENLQMLESFPLEQVLY